MMQNHKQNGQMETIHEPSLDLVHDDQTEDAFSLNRADIPVLLIFWLLVVIVFLQFFTRYVLNDSLGWTEEIARYLLILVGFIGSVTVVRKGGHIFLEFFYRFIPSQWTKALVIFSQVSSTFFYSYCAYLSSQVAMRMNQTLVSVPLPKSIIYWIVCACCVLMTLYSLIWLFKRIQQNHIEMANSINNQVITD
ncbi:TRAP transporter small permease [Marinomonas colpomeniae]|uniref:TRAP transporter small permease protein n=1 Tax=Marinomonas colpomeniae TaxID=2774408 RepID=A0ABR8NXV4_9GAMM|nr:TRAP transporter small permease [Marinomonas colpomeniae]MBD5770856.1 TRAP transporter small permease [Marinomonas colpomeniae]